MDVFVLLSLNNFRKVDGKTLQKLFQRFDDNADYFNDFAGGTSVMTKTRLALLKTGLKLSQRLQRNPQL